ncbi:MAG TPA: S9 family peptidase [candidate division Zixibacteria bacterium]|nr:S9 family peptidase [candidate division Zixibacteria bacterium]
MLKKIPTILEKHGRKRIDPYYWLRERENPEVLAYLRAENERAERETAHLRALEDALFEEIKARFKPADQSVPYRKCGYFYYTRFEEGKEYPILARKRGSLDAAEEIMLDGNELARGHEFFSIGGWAVSSGSDVLAYATDTVGRRVYTIHFKNLTTGETLDEAIPEATESLAWANDNRTLFYAKQDPVTLRSCRIFRHALGSDPSRDVLVFEETDETFSTYVFKTKSNRFIMIVSSQTLSQECRYLEADDPESEPRLLLARQRDHEYYVEHFEDRFLIRTNRGAKNFRLVAAPVEHPAEENWVEIVPHREDVLLSDFEVFARHLAVEERRRGLVHIRVIPWSGGAGHELVFDEPSYRAGFGDNPELDTALLRIEYTSMKTPVSIYDHDMDTGERRLLKREEVLGGFDPDDYVAERLYAQADGVEVPISIVYRRGVEKNGRNPLLLYGYGAYGLSTDAAFSSPRLSLIDRGFVYAIAHVRGGQELGRSWYEDGKLLKKKNTFTDFIACAEHLIREGYTCPDLLFAMGRSAGGLLMGAIANMRPDLFKGIVAEVPFVDVVTTMLDPSVPLTTGEYDEWGDPNDEKYFDYMLSYSPYDNVEAKDYPHMLITAGLHDSQVQYWEPAKWVAKLRELKTDRNRLLFKTNMEAGHGGASGRFRRYRETAFCYAFLLDLAGRAGRTS